MQKILIVDDEKETLFLLIRFFTKKGFDVLNASSGKKAIELAKTHRPQLVLLDIRMEDVSGLDILKEIKEFDRNIKVLMLSALDDEETIIEAKKLGADGYIPKPLSMEYIEKVISSRISD